ncbi:MAG TPA: 4,5-DOPA dioxygenase extradiol [Bacteroidia bacterium]|nr:4,5-DOPA dioxygenase extradiol [Bacteroidia bacterium]
MERRQFITQSLYATFAMTGLHRLYNSLSNGGDIGTSMPVFFIGHGSPMNAIEENQFTKGWEHAAAGIPRPKAILCISAHWETRGSFVTAMEHPRTIHDFYGFPDELFRKSYPAPGTPDYATLTIDQVKKTHIEKDFEWGLDHGTWSVLCKMFPLADIPVYQLSLDATKPAKWHYELGKELLALRKKGVLIIGSGNMVHNLRLMRMDVEGFEWAQEADAKLAALISKNDDEGVINFTASGRAAELAVPTNEHFLPLLYTLGLRGKNEAFNFFNDKLVMGSVSMRSFRIG